MRIYAFFLAAVILTPSMTVAQGDESAAKEQQVETKPDSADKTSRTPSADVKSSGPRSAPQLPEGHPGRQSNPPIEGKLFPAPGTAASTD